MSLRMTLIVYGVIFLFGIIGCGGEEEMSPTLMQAKQSKVSILLTDAPTNADAVYVTIDEILIHKKGSCSTEDENIIEEDSNDSQDDTKVNIYQEEDGCNDDEGWITVAKPHKTIDLLTLQNGETLGLGEENVEAGTYTQIRMILGFDEDNSTNLRGEAHPYANYILYTENSVQEVAELTVPSGQIIVNHGFEVNEAGTYEVTIDFDADQSIHQVGKNGKWILTPVLKVTGHHILQEDHDNVETDILENNETMSGNESNETEDDNETFLGEDLNEKNQNQVLREGGFYESVEAKEVLPLNVEDMSLHSPFVSPIPNTPQPVF